MKTYILLILPLSAARPVAALHYGGYIWPDEASKLGLDSPQLQAELALFW